MQLALVGVLVLWWACPVAVHCAPITIFTQRTAFDAAVGPTSLEDFTVDGPGVILTGPLNATSSYPARFGFEPLLPGDIVPGVTFTSPGASDPVASIDDVKFALTFGSVLDLDHTFLATMNRAGPRQPITVEFSPAVAAFGFDADEQTTGQNLTAEVVFTTGASTTLALENPNSIGTRSFFGFRSDDADIARVTFVGTADAYDIGFGFDNFAFTSADLVPPAIPLPPAVLMAPVAVGCGVFWRRRAPC